MTLQSDRDRFAPIFQLTATAIGTVILLSACGGGGGGDAGPTPSTPTATGPLTLVADSNASFKLPDATVGGYQKHLLTATANAGLGPFAPVASPATTSSYDAASLRRQWCYSAENPSAPPELFVTAQVPPTQMFDDVWAFGLSGVLQYAFRQPDGRVFLLDTLNNASEAQNITVPGLAAMGSSGSALIGAMPTHGHGDHTGGSGYLQQTFGIPIYLGSADAAVGARGTPPFTVTPIPSDNLSPQDRSFGSLNTTLLSTPGHTPGTLSGIMPVTLSGKKYSLAFWGGTSMPTNAPAAKQYLDGSERLYKLAEAKKIDGTLHTHAFVDGSLEKLGTLKADPAVRTTANPFLIGNALAMRSLATLRECSAAKVNQLDAAAVIPSWHVTTLQLDQDATAAGFFLKSQVTVRNPYGALRNASVTFTFAPGGQVCTAFTDEKGTASCSVGQGNATSVTAVFTEAKLEDGSVQLGSSASLALR